jgi:L-ascorbate 6-phosphate lactonase
MNLTLQSLREFPVPAGALAVWWLGQAGFLLKSPGGVVCALDPYLSDSCAPSAAQGGMDFSRRYPPPLAPTELAGVDLYVVTHSHQDHLDPDTLRGCWQAGGTGPYIAPPEAAEKLIAWGVAPDRVTMVWPNKAVTLGDLTIRTALAIPFGGDDLTHVGYLISAAGGPVFYFTGDTAYHEVLGISAAEHHPDVLFTVINGTFRNLSPAEAALLARTVQPRVVIPYHYDLFPDGHMPPQALRMNLMLHGLQDRYLALTPGVPWVFPNPAVEQ